MALSRFPDQLEKLDHTQFDYCQRGAPFRRCQSPLGDRTIFGAVGRFMISQRIGLARVHSHDSWDESLGHMAIEKMNQVISVIKKNRGIGTQKTAAQNRQTICDASKAFAPEQLHWDR